MELVSSIWENRKEIDMNIALAEAKRLGIYPEISAILTKRGLNLEDFANEDTFNINNGTLLYGASLGVDIIVDAIKNNEIIYCINDYDVDGVTSGEIVRYGITSLGGNCTIVTPDREIDGYGLSKRLVDIAKDNNAGLIITTDNGISAMDSIEYAKNLDIKVVLTDHHEVPYIENNTGEKNYLIPNADAVINPHLPYCNYPFKEICGAVVAMKVIYLLIDRALENNLDGFLEEGIITEEKAEKIKEYILELACIGTVCDVMPIIEENRIIVKRGLELLKNSRNVGLRKLMSIMDINPFKINLYDIGYRIGPALNSASRMTNSANLSNKLVSEKDFFKAKSYAFSLYQLNEDRKKESLKCEELAKNIIDSESKTIFVYLPDQKPSLMGILAGRIKEKFNKPCVCFTDDSKGNLKGSGRSIAGYDMFNSFLKYKDLYVKFGGHEGAIGISIPKSNFDKVKEVINNDLPAYENAEFEKKYLVDLFMNVSRVSYPLANAIKSLEPFGHGNEAPVFCSEGISICDAKRFGENGNFLKLYTPSTDGRIIEIISFDDAEAIINKLGGDIRNIPKVDILYNIGINTFGNNNTEQIKLKDIRIAS